MMKKIWRWLISPQSPPLLLLIPSLHAVLISLPSSRRVAFKQPLLWFPPSALFPTTTTPQESSLSASHFPSSFKSKKEYAQHILKEEPKSLAIDPSSTFHQQILSSADSSCNVFRGALIAIESTKKQLKDFEQKKITPKTLRLKAEITIKEVLPDDIQKFNELKKKFADSIDAMQKECTDYILQSGALSDQRFIFNVRETSIICLLEIAKSQCEFQSPNLIADEFSSQLKDSELLNSISLFAVLSIVTDKELSKDLSWFWQVSPDELRNFNGNPFSQIVFAMFNNIHSKLNNYKLKFKAESTEREITRCDDCVIHLGNTVFVSLKTLCPSVFWRYAMNLIRFTSHQEAEAKIKARLESLEIRDATAATQKAIDNLDTSSVALQNAMSSSKKNENAKKDQGKRRPSPPRSQGKSDSKNHQKPQNPRSNKSKGKRDSNDSNQDQTPSSRKQGQSGSFSEARSGEVGKGSETGPVQSLKSGCGSVQALQPTSQQRSKEETEEERAQQPILFQTESTQLVSSFSSSSSRRVQQRRKRKREKKETKKASNLFTITYKNTLQTENNTIKKDFGFLANPSLSVRENLSRYLASLSSFERDAMFCINRSFHNLCRNSHISPSVVRILGLNLKFGLCFLPPPKDGTSDIDFSRFRKDIRTKFEFLLFEREDNPYDEWNPKLHISSTRTARPASFEIESAITHFETRILQQIKSNKSRFVPNLTRHEQSVLSDLTSNPDVIIMPSDKNLGPVALDTSDYVNQVLQEHLLNEKNYQILSQRNALLKLNKASVSMWLLISDICDSADLASQELSFFKRAFAIKQRDGFRIAQFYGMPKVHKSPIKMRPVVSKCNDEFEILSKYLDSIFQKILNLSLKNPNTKLNPNNFLLPVYLRDSWDLLDKVKKTWSSLRFLGC